MADIFTLNGTLANLGLSAARVLSAYVHSNLPGNDGLVDVTGEVLLLGSEPVKVDSKAGTWSVQLVDTDAADLNVLPGTLRYELVVNYMNGGTRLEGTYTSGWFELTADASFTQLDLATSPIAVISAESYVASAAAASTSAAASATSAAASAAIAAAIAGADTVDDLITVLDADEDSDFRQQQDARQLATFETQTRANDRAILVSDYGPMGAVDDAATIEEAMAEANGRTLMFPPDGTFNSSGLVLSNGQRMVIDGNGSTINLLGNGARHGLQLAGVCDGVKIRNLRMQGTGVVSDQQAGVWVSNGATILNSEVSSCIFDNLTIGVSVNLDVSGTLKNWVVRNNFLDRMIGTNPGEGYGIHVSTSMAADSGVVISDNLIDRSQRHAIYLAQGRGHIVQGNTMLRHRDTVANGLVRAALTVLRSHDVTIMGNKVIGANDGSFKVASDTGTVDGVTLTGNTFLDPANTVPLVEVGDSTVPSVGVVRNILFSGNRMGIANTGRVFKMWNGIDISVLANLITTETSGTSCFEFTGTGDAGLATATYNDRIAVSGNVIRMTGSGTNRVFRLSGIETSTAAMAFLNNMTSGGASEFVGSVNATNPNITVGGQPLTGLVFTGGAVPKVAPVPIAKAASPGTAAGSDAAVINALVTVVRNAGLCT